MNTNFRVTCFVNPGNVYACFCGEFRQYKSPNSQSLYVSHFAVSKQQFLAKTAVSK